jgi:hypothetical protein
VGKQSSSKAMDKLRTHQKKKKVHRSNNKQRERLCGCVSSYQRKEVTFLFLFLMWKRKRQEEERTFVSSSYLNKSGIVVCVIIHNNSATKQRLDFRWCVFQKSITKQALLSRWQQQNQKRETHSKGTHRCSQE